MFILMDKKNTKAYTHLFQYIDVNILKLEASEFITDYEVALKNGLKAIYPVANYQNCWFHYCQALRRNLTTKHKKLAGIIRSNKSASMFLHKLMAMALLPHYCMESTFITLKLQIRTAFPNDEFESFMNYYEKFWMKKVGPRNFSVYKKVTRTTSDIEAYKGVLGRMISKKGNFYKFVRVLQDEELMKSRDFKMLIESGGAVGAKKRKSSAIQRNKELLEKGNITAMRFLDRMVYRKNNICTDMEPYDDILEDFPEDEIDEEDTEEAQLQNNEHDPNVCIICVDIPPNIVLLPCKHLHICSACNLKLQAQSIAEGNNSYLCPVCRYDVVDSMQIYTVS